MQVPTSTYVLLKRIGILNILARISNYIERVVEWDINNCKNAYSFENSRTTFFRLLTIIEVFIFSSMRAPFYLFRLPARFAF